MMPLRHALTGTKVRRRRFTNPYSGSKTDELGDRLRPCCDQMGPAVGQVILFVGRDKVLARLESAITRAESEVLEKCDA